MHSQECDLRVLIADRPGPARSAMASTLSALDDVVVVGAEGCAPELGAALRALRPDVVVIDDRLLAEWRTPYDPRVKVIVVGVDDDPAYAARAARRHAVAWVAKECAGDEIGVLLEQIRGSLNRTMPQMALARHGRPGSAP